MKSTEHASDGLHYCSLLLGKAIGALLVFDTQGIYGPVAATTQCSLTAASRALHLAAAMLNGTAPQHGEAAAEGSDMGVANEVTEASFAAVNAMTEHQKRTAGDLEYRFGEEALQAQVAELVDIAVALIDNARESVQP